MHLCIPERQHCPITQFSDDREKKKTAELVDSNKLEGKTTTINDRADSCNEVYKLSLKAETDLKKKKGI